MKKFIKIFVILLILLSINTTAYALENTNDVDTTIWGKEIISSGHKVYVKDSDGSLQWSIPLTKGLCMFRGDFEYSHTWYGLDNSKGTYEDGSMFWVKMIFKDSLDYNYYEQRLDEDYFTNESDIDWIIRFGVTKPDGTIIELDRDNDFLKDIDLYIEIGEVWDRDLIKNYFDEMDVKNIKYENFDREGIQGFFAKISNKPSTVGTTFSQGNIYIMFGIVVVLVAICVGVIIITKKKKLKN